MLLVLIKLHVKRDMGAHNSLLFYKNKARVKFWSTFTSSLLNSKSNN